MEDGRSLLLTTLTAALLAAVAGCGGGGNSAHAGGTANPPPPPSGPRILPTVTDAWHVPTCAAVNGAPISFTSDGGLHRAAIEAPAAANYFTYGVVALAGGSTLAAVVGTTTQGSTAEIFFSTDAGCSWRPSGQTLADVSYADAPLSASQGYAYVWGNRSVHVIEPTGIARAFDFDGLPWWVSGPYGLGIDRNDPTRIRVALYDCQHRASCGRGSDILETTNAGATWTRVGAASLPYLGFRVRFSPTSLDHAIAPFGRVGSQFNDAAGYVTFDGSNSWLAGRGPPTDWSTDDVAIGPDGQTVWLLAHTASPPLQSAIYVSRDGGLNYQEAFAASDENPFGPTNPFGNQTLYPQIFPHPSDVDIVYLAHTSRADATSYLYHYDAGLDALTKQEWPSEEGGVWSIAFNPADPQLVYLGLLAAE